MVVAAAAAVADLPLSAQSPVMQRLHLRGQMIDSTGRAIPGVSMKVDGTTLVATSDSLGWFALDSLPAGLVAVTFTHPRFLSITVSLPVAPGDTSRMPVMLTASDDRPSIGVTAAMLFGRVVDQSGFPVKDAEVLLATSGQTVVSDSAGRFVFADLMPARHLLRVRKIGYFAQYLSVTSTPTTAVRAQIAMESMGTALAEVVVRADRVPLRLKRFRERKAADMFGQFATRDEFAERGWVTVNDVLSHMRGVTMGSDAIGRPVPMSRFDCPMRVLLDGLPLELDGVSLSALVNIRDLAGVEVYVRGKEAPLEFSYGFGGRSSGCGVVLLWTR
jgi:Carboxypeptidase regulatory-like domain